MNVPGQFEILRMTHGKTFSLPLPRRHDRHAGEAARRCPLCDLHLDRLFLRLL
jgi:hypothetical protein